MPSIQRCLETAYSTGSNVCVCQHKHHLPSPYFTHTQSKHIECALANRMPPPLPPILLQARVTVIFTLPLGESKSCVVDFAKSCQINIKTGCVCLSTCPPPHLCLELNALMFTFTKDCGYRVCVYLYTYMVALYEYVYIYAKWSGGVRLLCFFCITRRYTRKIKRGPDPTTWPSPFR